MNQDAVPHRDSLADQAATWVPPWQRASAAPVGDDAQWEPFPAEVPVTEAEGETPRGEETDAAAAAEVTPPVELPDVAVEPEPAQEEPADYTTAAPETPGQVERPSVELPDVVELPEEPVDRLAEDGADTPEDISEGAFAEAEQAAERAAEEAGAQAAEEGADEIAVDPVETVAAAVAEGAEQAAEEGVEEDADDDVSAFGDVNALEARLAGLAQRVEMPKYDDAPPAEEPAPAPAGEAPEEQPEAAETQEAHEAHELQEAQDAAQLAALDPEELRGALEAILMVVDEPVGEIMLAQVLEQPTEAVADALLALSAAYTAENRGFELRRAAGGWRFYTREAFASYVERFVLDGQSVRLTQAALETLAVVAYKQPVTRSRISAIRGVNCDGVVRTLVSRGLIEECGAEPDTGAHLYRTTAMFLEKLGLDSLDQLPPLAPFLPDNLEEIADADR